MKYEFNADLDNISIRMAYLENSLDSKIDNLVSSYLTRNGIWNGELQQVKNNIGTTPSTDSDILIFDNITKGGLMLLPYYIDIDFHVGVYNTTSGAGVRVLGASVSYYFEVGLDIYNANTSESYQSDTLFYTPCGEYDN